MDKEQIIQSVKRIKAIARDPEAAHQEEDALRGEFIRFVANSGETPFSEMAEEVLKTEDIEFPRWYS